MFVFSTLMKLIKSNTCTFVFPVFFFIHLLCSDSCKQGFDPHAFHDRKWKILHILSRMSIFSKSNFTFTGTDIATFALSEKWEREPSVLDFSKEPQPVVSYAQALFSVMLQNTFLLEHSTQRSYSQD